MKVRLALLSTFVLFTVGVVAALGPARISAAINYVYLPPPGWQRTTYLARGLGTWANAKNDQTITVSATTYTGSINAFAHAKLAQIQALPNAKVGAAQQATVCAHHPARYLAYEATVNGKSELVEEMLAVYTGVGYEAKYVRGPAEPSQYDARASLTTLCGGMPPQAQIYSHPPQPYRTAGATPNVGPIQSSQPYGPVAPTVPPDVAPTVTPETGPGVTPGP